MRRRSPWGRLGVQRRIDTMPAFDPKRTLQPRLMSSKKKEGFMRQSRWLAVVLLLGFGMSLAKAEEIVALFPLSMEHTAHEVLPPFEKSSGHKVTVQYG